MTQTLTYSIPLIAAYLIGAIPFGLLVARSRGIDIRRHGSGNIGATNVFRTVGKSWGILTLLLDALKGLLPTLLLPRTITMLTGATPHDALAVGIALLAVCGHNWPIYLRFKGGKGVATTAGALLGLAPAVVGIGILCFALVFTLTRFVSLGSIIAATVIPVVAWFIYPDDWLLPSFLTLLGLMVIWRHRANISRLLAGTENRIELGKGKKQ